MAYEFHLGTIPLLISFPHNGSAIPAEIAAHMTEAGRSSRDTDWFLDQLYDVPEASDASRLIAQTSRYVIDLNRPKDDTSLYPGQTTTGLLPTSCFDGEPIYRDALPDRREQERRVAQYWLPYHRQLEAELRRMVAEFGIAVLIEAHSIASVVPRLFEGVLPDFNFGTHHGNSCHEDLMASLLAVVRLQTRYTHVLNGRFVGGYITRHYGQPAQRVHAVQIELSQATYLNESTRSWNAEQAQQVQAVFRELIGATTKWIQSH